MKGRKLTEEDLIKMPIGSKVYIGEYEYPVTLDGIKKDSSGWLFFVHNGWDNIITFPLYEYKEDPCWLDSDEFNNLLPLGWFYRESYERENIVEAIRSNLDKIRKV